jgi:hypothetical protein
MRTAPVQLVGLPYNVTGWYTTNDSLPGVPSGAILLSDTVYQRPIKKEKKKEKKKKRIRNDELFAFIDYFSVSSTRCSSINDSCRNDICGIAETSMVKNSSRVLSPRAFRIEGVGKV